MKPALSPEEMITLGKALDRIVEKYGPFDDVEREVIAEKLVRFGHEGTWDIDRLVQMATPLNKRN